MAMRVINKCHVVIKELFPSINDFILFLIYLLFVISTSCVVLKVPVSSYFFYSIYITITIWFVYVCFTKVKNNKFKFVYLITDSFFLLVCFIVISSFNVIITIKNATRVNFDFFKKAIGIFVGMMFLYSVCKQKIDFRTIKKLFILNKLLLIIFAFGFVTGISRTFQGFSRWHMLNMNFSNPNAFAIISSGCVIFEMVALTKEQFFLQKIVSAVLIVFNLFLIYLTDCRNVLIAFALVALVYLFIIFSKNKSNFVILSVLSMTVVFTASYFIYFCVLDHQGVSSIFSDSAGKAFSTRYEMWLRGLRKIISNPVLGTYSSMNGDYQWHNLFIDIFASFGVFSTILFSITIIKLYFDIKPKENNSSSIFAFAASFIFVFFGIFEGGIFSPYYFIAPFAIFVINKYPFTRSNVSAKYSILFNNPVIQINSVFKSGSTGSICYDVANFLSSKDIENIIIYARGETKEKDEDCVNCVKIGSEIRSFVSKILNQIFKKYTSFNYINTLLIYKEIKQLKPSCILLHSLVDDSLNLKLFLLLLSKKHIPVIFVNHSKTYLSGGYCFSQQYNCDGWKNGCANCPRFGKKANKYFNHLQSIFLNFDPSITTVVSVSNYMLQESACSLLLNRFKNVSINNGIDTNIYTFSDNVNVNNKQLLFVTPNLSDPLKGFAYVEELSKKMTDYQFLVVAPHARKTTRNLTVVPYENRIDLAEKYKSSYATLIFSKSETFSLVTAESLCCGTPVIGFKSGGPESIAPKEITTFFDYGDLDSVERAIKDSAFSTSLRRIISDVSIKSFNIEKMCVNYYKEILFVSKQLRMAKIDI